MKSSNPSAARHFAERQLNMLRTWTPTGMTIVLALLANSSLLAQRVVEGRVVDQVTLEAIPFVHIAAGEGVRFGGVSSIEGYYKVAVPAGASPSTPITLSCIGYESRTIALGDFSGAKVIRLTPKAAELSEVVVKAKEDPGYEIIRRAAANRKNNNPEQLDGFRLMSYNKAGMDVERRTDVQAELENTGFANARFFMLESTTELVYKKPGKWNETITATQISGMKNPQFSILSNSFQPFTTYTDHLNLMETDWLNPVSPGSDNRYVFQLTDSAMIDGEKVYMVTFQPRAKVTGNLLKGTVTLSSVNYAIVNLRASNSNRFNLLDFEIRQNYAKLEGKWFPKESKTLYTIYLDNSDVEGTLPMLLYSTTYFTDIDLNYAPTSKDFNVAQVVMADGAGQVNREQWDAIRPLALDTAENNTYAVFDTLPAGMVNTLNWFMNQSASLAAGRLTFGKVDVLLNHIMRFNRYEGFRLGAGLSTNQNFIRWMSLEGYAAYGFRDKRAKYGAGMVFHLSRRHAFDFALRYHNDVLEPGRGPFGRDFSFTQTGFGIRNLFAEIMNPVETYSAEVTVRPMRGLKTDFGFMRERRSLIANEVLGEFIFPTTQVYLTQWRVAVQWVPGESLMQMGNAMVPTGFKYPRFRWNLSGGLPDVLEGTQDFVRSDFEMAHQFRLRRAGELQLFGGIGKVWGTNVAFPYLNFGRGSNGFDGVGVETTGYFQTMLLYDFLMDEYAYGGFRHNFGTVFGIEEKWTKPELKVAYTAGVGNLTQGNRQDIPIAYRQMNKPYLEGGMVIDNIVRFKTSGGASYNGLGFGAFMLHGHYASPRFGDNMVYVISFRNSF